MSIRNKLVALIFYNRSIHRKSLKNIMKTLRLIFVLAISIFLMSPEMHAQQVASISEDKSIVLNESIHKSVTPFSTDEPKRKKGIFRKMVASPGMGALTGFVIGATGGVVLGLTGKDWVLKNGKVVSRPVHAVVDALIVGAPLALMGTVWGARRDRAELTPQKWHFAIGGGWSGVKTYKSMLNAATLSGLPRHIPHWFGYLHYPDGANSSVPYTWKVSMGFSFNNFVKQSIVEGIDHHDEWHDYEYAMGESYSLLGDYVINPIVPENKTRLVVAVGAGASVHRLVAGGLLGNTGYRIVKASVTSHWRMTVDYMSRKNLSLQLKAGYKPEQWIRIPEQTDGTQTLLAHTINYRALDVTIGVRWHFDKLFN
jgi:hypothetical protein